MGHQKERANPCPRRESLFLQYQIGKSREEREKGASFFKGSRDKGNRDKGAGVIGSQPRNRGRSVDSTIIRRDPRDYPRGTMRTEEVHPRSLREGRVVRGF